MRSRFHWEVDSVIAGITMGGLTLGDSTGSVAHPERSRAVPVIQERIRMVCQRSVCGWNAWCCRAHCPWGSASPTAGRDLALVW